jgi:predicted DNA-binding transcriptional regulator YafY
MKAKPNLTKNSSRNLQTRRVRRGTTVRIIFDADVAALVRKRRWFRQQTITRLPDGRIELRGMAASLIGIDRWVFGWGPSAIVVEPSRLRRRIVDMAQTIVARG